MHTPTHSILTYTSVIKSFTFIISITVLMLGGKITLQETDAKSLPVNQTGPCLLAQIVQFWLVCYVTLYA